MGTAISLDFGAVVSDFISAAATGTTPTGQRARETAAFGTRGDGKTWAALGAMIAHAKEHQAAGYPLPVKWAGVTDTFRSHTEKTHDSLMAPDWGGVWRLEDGGHEARCVIDNQTLVRLRLFGIEDQGAMNRLRMECHGLWFEEPAPALAISSGISEDAWALGLTSQRLPSHCKPAILTTNYPDEEHWTWQRFVVREHPGTCYFRIPPGERATEEDRAEWERALEGRPDMQRRLLGGEPGTVQLGEQVAHGFRYDAHVATGKRLKPSPEAALWIGQDGGESHTWVSVIGQRIQGRVRIYAALLSEPSGARQHARELLLPWLSEHAPWTLERRDERVVVVYDQAMDSTDPGDAESNPLRTFRALLPGQYKPGPVSWAGRLNPMLALFNLMADGRPILEIDASCRGLITALNGGWYYPKDAAGRVSRDLPKKPNHPHEDYGDAFCYLVAGLAPTKGEGKPRAPYHATTAFNPLRYGYPKKQPGVGTLLPHRSW